MLNRPRLGRLTRESRASGMRYQASSNQPIRAQIEPFSGCLASLEHPYEHPHALRFASLDAGGCATTCTRCGAGSVAGTTSGATWRSLLGGPLPWPHHPIAHSMRPLGNAQPQPAMAPIPPGSAPVKVAAEPLARHAD